VRILASLFAAFMLLATTSCAFDQSPDGIRAGRQWNAMIGALADEGKSFPVAYHNPQHDAARVEEMRAGVSEARARFEQRIAALRAATEEQTYDRAIAERQLRVLDRYDALAALMERVRFGAISGDIEPRAAIQINNYALFGEVDWTFAEFTETVPQDRGEDAEYLMRAIALDWRAQAFNAFARRDVLLGDSSGVASAQQSLRQMAVVFHRLADESESPRDLSWWNALQMSAEDRARRAPYLEGAPGHIRAHAVAIEQLAEALTTVTPQNVNEIPWQAFVERYPPPPEHDASP
jgi:hypothetical protein